MKFTIDTAELRSTFDAIGSALKALDWKNTCLITARKQRVVVEASAGGGYFKRTLKAKVDDAGEMQVAINRLPEFPASTTTFSRDGARVGFISGRLKGAFDVPSDVDAVDRIDKAIKDGIVISAPLLHQLIRTVLFAPANPEIPIGLRICTRAKHHEVKAVAFDSYRAAIFQQTFPPAKAPPKHKDKKPDKDKKPGKGKPQEEEPTVAELHAEVLDDVDYMFTANMANAIYGLFDDDIHIGATKKLACFADAHTVLFLPYMAPDKSEDVDDLMRDLRHQKPRIEALLDPHAAEQTIAPACSIISRKEGLLTLVPDAGKGVLGVQVASEYAKTRTQVDLLKAKIRDATPFDVAYGYLMEFLANIAWYITPADDDTEYGAVTLQVFKKCLTLSVPQAIYVMPLRTKKTKD
jgi:hypothetical protein